MPTNVLMSLATAKVPPQRQRLTGTAQLLYQSSFLFEQELR